MHCLVRETGREAHALTSESDDAGEKARRVWNERTIDCRALKQKGSGIFK